MHVWMLVLLMALALAQNGCSANAPTAQDPPKQPLLTSQEIPSDTVMTLTRTACFGACPVYELTISADGTVVFEGKRFVGTEGTAKSQLGKAELLELIKEFERINYFLLDDAYTQGSKGCPQVATDSPSAITSITINGKYKSVHHYYGCSGAKALEDLTRLERRIDEITGSKKWVGK